MQQTFRFANKPGVAPGKPLAVGTANDLKHIARIESRHAGIRIDCRKLTTVSARLVIGSLGRHAGEIEQRADGRVSVRMGGAF